MRGVIKGDTFTNAPGARQVFGSQTLEDYQAEQVRKRLNALGIIQHHVDCISDQLEVLPEAARGLVIDKLCERLEKKAGVSDGI